MRRHVCVSEVNTHNTLLGCLQCFVIHVFVTVFMNISREGHTQHNINIHVMIQNFCFMSYQCVTVFLDRTSQSLMVTNTQPATQCRLIIPYMCTGVCIKGHIMHTSIGGQELMTTCAMITFVPKFVCWIGVLLNEDYGSVN